MFVKNIHLATGKQKKLYCLKPIAVFVFARPDRSSGQACSV
jgi:hypothetical protein